MRKLLPLIAALAVTGCGLHPLYDGGSRGAAAIGFRSIEVGPIPQRSGWLTRNALVDRFDGEHPAGLYRLEVELDDRITGFGIRGDSATTRETRTLRARYRLVERASGAVVLDATAGSDAGIDVVSSEYATIAAEQTATERLSALVADQIVARLARYMTATAGRR
ncbi:LPS assembly lipoprotein LptE [Sphingomonas sp.]|uniref:LPS assembly lipoprotein LptE n=1 Tax=Sphingomonas sp. TaxID=28214 RepID=UPI00375125F8